MSNKDIIISTIDDFKKSLNGQTISIHGKDYATVALRVAVARRSLGSKLSIVTKLVHKDADTVTMKATVYVDGRVASTGYAEEKRSASRINQTSALENAETSAVGRAMAFLGLIADGIASAEEVSLAIEQQDKKLQKCVEELQSVSHKGNYNQWLTNYKSFLQDLKTKNPVGYASFQERFTEIKTNLHNKGVI